MNVHTHGFETPLQWAAPFIIATVWVLAFSLVREPRRRSLSALFLAGASTIYVSGGGLGPWELVFCTILSAFAYQGLTTTGLAAGYPWIGTGWLLHAAWDAAHHVNGNPLVPFDATSALGCAVCDPILAVWYFAGAPSLWPIRSIANGRVMGRDERRV